MKARVKATNTIHDVMSIDLLTSGLGEPVQDITTFSPEDIELTEQDTVPCDLWERRRYELARDLLPSFAIAVNAYNTATGGAVINFLLSKEEAAQKAVEYADALINELKKQDNDKG